MLLDVVDWSANFDSGVVRRVFPKCFELTEVSFHELEKHSKGLVKL